MGGLDRTVMGEPVIDMYIDGFDYEYKIKKNNVQRKNQEVRTPNFQKKSKVIQIVIIYKCLL